jgi:hypothetical protein
MRFGQNVFNPMCEIALRISLMLRNLHTAMLNISRHSVWNRALPESVKDPAGIH